MKKIFGLVGFPLDHSWSKKFFDQKFEKECLNHTVYENFPIEEIGSFRKLIDSNTNIVGLNVTIPYKERIIPFVDELDPTAREVGAVNTIKIARVGGKTTLVGYNTDVFGFEQSLANNGVKLGLGALVLGNGGASRAAQFVLKKNNCPYVVVSRKQLGENTLTYSQLTNQTILDNHLIINTTPLGMYPNVDSCPNIPYEAISGNHVLFDLVYNPTETQFLKRGKQAGGKVINGMEMLRLQALAAWDVWNAEP